MRGIEADGPGRAPPYQAQLLSSLQDQLRSPCSMQKHPRSASAFPRPASFPPAGVSPATSLVSHQVSRAPALQEVLFNICTGEG
jgi:hypothetical protein